MMQMARRTRRPIEREQTPSSIGEIGIVQTERGRVMRRKGFVTQVIETEDELRRFREDFLEAEISRMNHQPWLSDITRLQVRVVINSELLQSGKSMEHIEAVVNIGKINGSGNYAIVYFGHNKQERSITGEQREEYNRRWVLTNLSRNIERLSDILSSPTYKGYTISRVDHDSMTQAQRTAMLGMLNHSFNYNEHDSNYILDDPNNTFFVATTQTGEVVGMSMAERRRVNLTDGRSVMIAEVTNATVIRGHGGNGLYGAISAHLIRHLAGGTDPETRVDLVYSESNIDRQSLLNAIAMQHRTVAGMMPNNSFVDNELRTMLVTYLNRQELDALYLGGIVRR